jgi:2-polyprenyl-6-methoxyphenol hydroxylase-like FAD-dependent oxidoreductase
MKERQTEVLVVGAGPVGLLTAVMLAEAGIEVQIIDREERTTTRSYACALHPRSVKLLDRLGLADEILERGRRIPRIAFYDGEVRRAELKFSQLDGDFPFLLALPQSVLENALEQRLQKAGLTVQWNHRFDDFQFEEHSVVATVEALGGTAMGYIVPHWETVVKKRFPFRAQFLVGADGHSSLVRRRLDIDYDLIAGPQTFAACELGVDDCGDDEVRIVLDESTTNVFWPLAGNRCRWTFQLLHGEASEFPEKERSTVHFTEEALDDTIRSRVQKIARHRAPWFSANVGEIVWCSRVTFEHRLAKQFGQARCWLAGDAAHQTGPVGVQSMNVGLCEAETLATQLKKILREGARLKSMESYNRQWQEEWRRLLGLSGELSAREEKDAWVGRRSARILSCLPGSGEQLPRLASQLGLSFVELSPAPG